MSKNARVMRNILALLISQVGTWSSTFVLTLVVPPYLGVKLYGLYSFVGSYAGLFTIGMVLGTTTYLTWRTAREPEVASQLLVNTMVMQLPLWALWSAAALLILPRFDGRSLTLALLVCVQGATLCSILAGSCIASLAGFQIMRVPAFIGAATALCSAIGSVVCVKLHASVVQLAAFGVLVALGNLLVIMTYTHRRIRLVARLSSRLWLTIIAGGLPFLTWSIVLQVYGYSDVLLLKLLAGDSQVGWYAAANRLASIPVFFPNIVVTALLPALARERDGASPNFRMLASRAIRGVTAISLPAAAGTVLLAPFLVSLLHYPSSFEQVGPLVAILGINMPLVAIDMVMGTVLIAVGKQKMWTVVGAVAMVLNPALNFWAIPFSQHRFGNGAIGASIVTVATELLMLVGAMLLRPHGVLSRHDMFYIARSMLAVAVMVPAVRALAGQGTLRLAVAVVYGVTIYVAAAYTLRVFSAADVQAVVTTVLMRLGIDVTKADTQPVPAISGVPGALSPTFQLALQRVQGASRPLAGAVRVTAARVGQMIAQPAERMGSISRPLAHGARNMLGRISSNISRPVAIELPESARDERVADQLAERPYAFESQNADRGDELLDVPSWAQVDFAAPASSTVLPRVPVISTHSGKHEATVDEDQRPTAPVSVAKHHGAVPHSVET